MRIILLPVIFIVFTSSMVAARTFGDDALTSPRSIVSDENRLYRSAGLLECRFADGHSYRSNGFLIGSRTTLLANRQALGGRAVLTANEACKANFYAADGTSRDSVDVTAMTAPGRGVVKGDLVLFTLKRASPFAEVAFEYLHGSDPARLDRQPVYMVTLIGREGELRKVRSGGVAFRLKPGVAGQRNTPGHVAMAVNYDSVSASLGSPVLDASGKVIGVHSGSYCPMNGSVFDQDLSLPI